jgi:DNA modification methylase
MAGPVERNGYVLLSPEDFNAGALLGLRTPPPNVLIEGDCLKVLSFIPSNSIDLIFADPPYNLQLRTQDLRRPNNTLVDGVDDHWDQFTSFAEYDAFTEHWLTECRRILSPTGSLWVIGTYHNIFRVGKILQDVGYWILNDVIWLKCLAGETRVLVRYGSGWIAQRTLAQLAAGPAQPLEVLTPTGWRTLHAVARSSEPKPRARLRAGRFGQVVASPDHVVPIWRHSMERRYAERTLGSIACERESMRTYVLHVNLQPWLPGSYAELDVAELLREQGAPAYTRGGYTGCQRRHARGSWATSLARWRPIKSLSQHRRCDWLSVVIARDAGLARHRLAARDAKQAEAFPARLPLTEDLGFVIGLYLAEGSLAKRTQVRLNLHRNEAALLDRVDRVLKPLGLKLGRHYSRHGIAAYCRSRILRAVIQHFVAGTSARAKRLEIDRVLNAPVAFRKGLLDGFLAGDGHYEPERQRYVVGIASRQLVQDLQLLAHTLGYYATTGQYQASPRATGKRERPFWLKLYPRRERVADGITFYPVRARVAIDPEPSMDWYDVYVEGGLFLVEGGLVVHNSNPMPHFRGVRFTNAHETLIWAKKSEGARKITFNYRALKELNGGKQMRSDWYLPICNGAERLRDANGNKLHSTQKPEALLERVLLATSRPGDLVLDPFAGTGTTGVVAQRLGRRWIMIEREPAYCRLIEARLESVAQVASDQSDR